MVFSYWKVVHYELEANNTWSTTGTEITSFHSPKVKVSLGSGKDSFDYKHMDPLGVYDGFYKAGDKVIISRNINSTTIASSNVLLTGVINEVPSTISTSGSYFRVAGYNFTEALMNAYVFIDFSVGFTLDDALEAAINSVRLYNNNFQITWDAGNPSVNSSGSSFPTVYEKWYNKPLLNLVEKFSSNEYTEDGNYYYYVDNNNGFVWRRKTDAATTSIDVSLVPHRGYHTRKNLDDVKNWVILKGGSDPKNNPIQVKVDNPTSRAKHGFKPYIITDYTNYASTLMEQDKGSFGTANKYPASYPYVTKWAATASDSSESPSMTAGSTVSVSSNDQYTSVIRREVKNFLKRVGQAFIDAHKNGKYELEVEFVPGAYLWGLGDVLLVTNAKEGIVNRPMRVEEIEYSSVDDTFTLVETVGSV